jgi:hypothetical protein
MTCLGNWRQWSTASSPNSAKSAHVTDDHGQITGQYATDNVPYSRLAGMVGPEAALMPPIASAVGTQDLCNRCEPPTGLAMIYRAASAARCGIQYSLMAGITIGMSW